MCSYLNMYVVFIKAYIVCGLGARCGGIFLNGKSTRICEPLKTNFSIPHGVTSAHFFVEGGGISCGGKCGVPSIGGHLRFDRRRSFLTNDLDRTIGPERSLNGGRRAAYHCATRIPHSIISITLLEIK